MALSKNFNLVFVLITFLVFVNLVTEVVDGSFMEVWGGPGCRNGQYERYSDCGCSAIHENGGYNFVFQGQDIFLYNEEGCLGNPHTQLDYSTLDCRPFGWRSLWIQCDTV
ncbi:hypothetical protein MKW92_035135 [Papaver armeniacum]|nr:hypothetical protein MKW92_035135 [Papaver armeniacum]